MKTIRGDGAVTYAAIDIEDAFHNVPAGPDRRFTVAAAELEQDSMAYIVYNVLVFGARSSPTLWGRFATFLGRLLACTVPECTWTTHCYVCQAKQNTFSQ